MEIARTGELSQRLNHAIGEAVAGKTVIVVARTEERIKDLFHLASHNAQLRQPHVRFDLINCEIRMPFPSSGSLRFYLTGHHDYDDARKRVRGYPPSVLHIYDTQMEGSK